MAGWIPRAIEVLAREIERFNLSIKILPLNHLEFSPSKHMAYSICIATRILFVLSDGPWAQCRRQKPSTQLCSSITCRLSLCSASFRCGCRLHPRVMRSCSTWWIVLFWANVEMTRRLKSYLGGGFYLGEMIQID